MILCFNLCCLLIRSPLFQSLLPIDTIPLFQSLLPIDTILCFNLCCLLIRSPLFQSLLPIDTIPSVSIFVASTAGLGEFRIRDLNDVINKLIREKSHWQDRIRELGGADYFVSSYCFYFCYGEPQNERLTHENLDSRLL